MANSLTPSPLLLLQPGGLETDASRRLLAQGALDVQRRMQAGCPPAEFEQWRCIAAAIESATKTLAATNHREVSAPATQGEPTC